MKALATALGLALVGALAWYLLRDGDGRAGAAAPVAAVRPAEPSEPEVVAVVQEALAPESPRQAAQPSDPLPAPVEPAAGPDPQRSGTLAVTVVERDTGAVLEGARVSLGPSQPDQDGSVLWLGGPPDSSPTTDASGRASFLVAAGVACRLWTRGPDEGSSTSLEVEPLTAGELREVRLEVRTLPDVTLVGRVVEAQGGAPVANARVSFESTRSRYAGDGTRETFHLTLYETRTDGDGWFTGMAASWKYVHGRVEAEGYGLALFPIVHGNDSRERARVVELDAEALLHGRVLGAEETSAYRVRALLPGDELIGRNGETMVFVGELAREAAVSADGRWELRGLPARADLGLELRRADEVAQRRAEPVRLEPGEERALDWRLGSGATLNGTATIAGTGEPLAAHGIWLVAAADARGLLRMDQAPTARTVTDDAGRFRFEDVAHGEWRVGPAPTRADWEPAADTDVAAMPVPVVIPEGARAVDVQVLVHRGLFIEGEVREVDGELSKEGFVWGSSLVGDLWINVPAREGRFRLGPLVPGGYVVSAYSSGNDSADSEERTATAGDTGVVLQLRSGGQLHGRMVNALTGEPVPGEIRALAEPPAPQGWTMTRSQPDGSFAFRSMERGSYTLLGRSGQLVGQVQGVQTGGKDAPVTEVPMAPGAELTVRYLGELSQVHYQVHGQGGMLELASIGAGRSASVFLPAGSYELRVELPGSGGDPRELVRPVQLSEGQPTLVEFGDDDL